MTPFVQLSDPRVASDDEKENRAAAISFEAVSRAAKLNNYKEAYHNESSSIASYFRTERKYSVKVSVYYAQGIVGACVHSDRKGRIQLLLENMTTREVQKLLKDPSSYARMEGHEGDRYGKWKALSRHTQGLEEFDAVRRWRYCAAVTGLVADQHELNKVLRVITMYDELSFIPGSTRSNFTSDSRFRCGSKCCLETVLQEIARDYHGAAGFYWGCKGEYSPLVASLDSCPEAAKYWQKFGNDVQELKANLIGLPSHLRLDLVLWLFSRGHCESTFVDQSGSHFSFCCAGLEEAHNDYGYLTDSGKHKKKASMCWLHGINMPKPSKKA